MYVVVTTPLIRGSQIESLSYFSATNYPVGTLLSVPIRNKRYSALVTDTQPVTTTKSLLKKASFSLRRLPNQTITIQLPNNLIQTAQRLANKYPSPVGTILFHLLPPDVRNGTFPYPVINLPANPATDSIPTVLTARADERIIRYQAIIRETLARQGSVFLVVPTASQVNYFKNLLQKGISDRIVIFSPLQNKAARKQSYEKFCDSSNAKLIITTPTHAYLERPDISTIIIEQAASDYYVSRLRPYLDHKEALIMGAAVAGRRIILGDVVPRTEDEVYRREGLFQTDLGESVRRLAFIAPLTIINQHDKPHPDIPFQLFSPRLLTTITHALESSGKVFLYSARRGLAPVIVCIDCGYIFRCPDSNTPYSLLRTHRNNVDERWFVSGTSGRRVRAADTCPQCKSWRLRERGIGVQHVYDEWREKMPNFPIYLLDSETAPTIQSAKRIAEQFYQDRGAVLIGTKAALPFLWPGVDVSAVVSLDAARSVPTWKADESLFRLLCYLREHTSREVLVQTRTDTDDLLTHATSGAVEHFFDDEIALRQALKYPPYQQFILLTWTGNQETISKIENLVRQQLRGHELYCYNDTNSTTQKIFRHALLRIPREANLVQTDALRRLRQMPPYIKIEINPERIV